MRSAWIFCLIILNCTAYFAQSYTLKGIVLDADDSLPLIGAQVVYSELAGTTTDLEGHFELVLPVGTHSIRISMVGYETLSTTSSAPDNESSTYLEIVSTYRLYPKTELLNQVVISAGRYAQNVAEVTVSMEVLKPDLLRNRNLTSLDDALRETPGMIIVDNEPQIRSGSGYSFGAGSRIQILLDGIPQLSGDIGKPAWDNIPMEVVEQVEVIKGAASVLYGSAALSGVVHVRSTYPKGKPLTRIEAYGGAYAKPRQAANRYWSSPNILSGRSVMHASRIGNSDLVIGLDVLSDDGHLGPLQDTVGLPLRLGDAGSADHYKAERRARGWIKYRYRNQKIQGLSYGLTLNGQKNASMASLLWDNTSSGLYSAFEGSATETRQTITNVNPFIEYHAKQGGSIIYRGNWNSLDNENSNEQDNFSDAYFNEIQGQIEGKQFGVAGLKLITGVSSTLSTSKSKLYNNGGLDSSHESSNIAAYLQADMEVTDRLKASAGMRWEQFEVDGEKESKPVFRAGLNYRAGEATYLRASYGQGYRFPTIGERFISTQVGVLNIFPNPGLQSETSENMELGVKQGFVFGGFKGYVDVAIFHQAYENYIEFSFGQGREAIVVDDFLNSLGFTSLNTGSATVDGCELSIAAQGELNPKTSLSLLAGYTYTIPVSTSPEEDYSRTDLTYTRLDAFAQQTYRSTSSDPSNDILKYRMQHLARINADLTKGRINIGYGARYNSFMQNIDAVFIGLDTGEQPGLLGVDALPTGINQWRKDNDGGTLIFDMRMGYKFYHQHRISLIVDNLANKEYSIRPLVLESSRRVLLKLTFEI